VYSARGLAVLAAGIALAAGLPLAAEQGTPPPATPQTPAAAARPCRVRGVISSGEMTLAGVAITAKAGEKVVALTSTDIDGSFTVPFAPGTYKLRIELTGFLPVEKEVTVGQPPCELTNDVSMKLLSRASASEVEAVQAQTPAAPPPAAANPATPAQTAAAGTNAAAGGGRGQNAGQGPGRGGRGAPPQRFQTLSVTGTTAAAAAGGDAVLDVTPTGGRGGSDDPAARLLPAGFSLDAPLESVAVNGTMVAIDRNLMEERMQALGRGEFGLAEGQFGGPGGIGGAGAFAALGGEGGRGGQGGDLGGGGRGGGGAVPGLGGRLGGANRLQVSATYGLGSSALDSAPYALRPNQAQSKREYLNQNYSTTLGGPVVIPGIYNGASRTTFNFSYTGSRNGGVFDQYATVPTAELRAGNFSSIATPIINPATGQPFDNNQVPISSAAAALLNYIPEPTLDGTTRNFRRTSPTMSTSDSYSVRFTHSFTQPPAGRGGAGGRGGAAGGGRGGAAPTNTATNNANARGGGAANAAPANQPATTGQPASASGTSTGSTTTPPNTGTAGSTPPAAGTNPPANTAANQPAGAPGQAGGRAGGAAGGRGGANQQGRGAVRPPNLNVTMNATINYRRNEGDRLSVFPLLDGATRGSTVGIQNTVNVRYGRSMHNFSTSYNQTNSRTSSPFAFSTDIAGQAGILGVSTDPLDWGVPNITFSGSGFSALRDTAPSARQDKSFQFSYGWTRPAGRHNWRTGGSYNQQWNDTQSNSNSRGSFTFTGLYTANGVATTRGAYQDFADFLIGLPQQATRSYSINVNNIVNPVLIRGRNFSMYLQDDFRWKARWTVNYGVTYNVIFPFTEANGHMVNLDVAPDFSAVVPVESGQVGPYSGAFPSGLVNTDWNNLSPSVGVAWRNSNRSVIRFGYGLSYNSGTYSGIARNLYQQPPFFLTGTSLGTLATPLSINNAFVGIQPSDILNTFAIDPAYQLGLVHQWSADYGRDLFRSWATGVTYFGTLGRNLDMLRSPNRGPTGLRIDGVDPFTFQSSEGSSHANGVAFRLQKRQTHGVAGSVTYTLAHSLDNTTATGGGATVAQDDQNLDAEWARSNFDQRHSVSGNISVQLPWGPNRKWLNNGGLMAGVFGSWSMSTNITWNSGSPLTIRCGQCASDVARGTGGTLRADYNGQPIYLTDPTIDRYFNTDAFASPLVGTFGNSQRNFVTGPGSHQMNANFTRDVRLGGNRTMSITVNASNLLNTINYGGLDTNVNSPTFGQINSARGMRTIRLNMRFRF